MKFFVLIVVLFFSLNSVFAETNTQKIKQLSVQIQQLIVVDGTRKGYNSPSDIERRKKIDALNQEIKRLRDEDQQGFQKQSEAMQSEYLNLFENMKTCTRSGAKIVTGNQYILGNKNGVCYYQIDFGTSGNYFLCKFPMSVAKRYAEESLSSIKNNVKSSYVEPTMDKYCELLKR